MAISALQKCAQSIDSYLATKGTTGAVSGASIKTLQLKLNLYREIFSLARENRDEASVVQVMVDSIGIHFRADYISYSTLSSAGPIQSIHSSDLAGHVDCCAIERLIQNSPLYLETIRNKKNLIIYNLQKEPTLKILLKEQPLARIDCPVVIEEDVLGVLAVVCYQERKWLPFELETIQEIAEFTGFLLREARIKKNLEITQEQILSKAKFASLGEMASGIAHEINNPLSVVQGLACQLRQMVEAESNNSALLLESLETIDRMSKRIAAITKGLRTFSRQAEQDPMEPADLCAILQETLALCWPRMQASAIHLDLDQKHAKILVRCRPAEISQVLLNLLNNAMDALEQQATKKITIILEKREGATIFLIQDSGAGVAPDLAEKIFQPFYTTKAVGKGTGLGLPISRRIVENHEGKLYLDPVSYTSPGYQGARFVLELPLEA